MSSDQTEWPVELRGITETVITTEGPDGRYNAAALGVHAGDPVTARTWGRTRTRQNFEREGHGFVQFLRDPVVFVEAALGIRESADPILDATHCWVEVAVTHLDTADDDGTNVESWALSPVDSAVGRTVIPTINRGLHAVIEATVVVSRLDVPAYDTATLENRLAYFETVAERCGGQREREAFEQIRTHADELQEG